MGTILNELGPRSDQIDIRARFGQTCSWKDAQGEASVSAMTVRLRDVHGGFSSIELNWASLPGESQVCHCWHSRDRRGTCETAVVCSLRVSGAS